MFRMPGPPGRGVARMADARATFQGAENVIGGEMVGDETCRLVGVELLPVIGSDPSGLLAPML